MAGMRINVAHQIQIVIEGSCVQSVGQVVHEVACATFNEAMIIMEDVASSIVKHPSAAAEGGETQEVVQRRRRMRRFQVPTKARGMCRVVEEGQICLRPGRTRNLPDTPPSVAVGRQVGSVPGTVNWQPRATKIRNDA